IITSTATPSGPDHIFGLLALRVGLVTLLTVARHSRRVVRLAHNLTCGRAVASPLRLTFWTAAQRSAASPRLVFWRVAFSHCVSSSSSAVRTSSPSTMAMADAVARMYIQIQEG